MDSSKILITGRSGQLGRALSEYYPSATSFDSSQLNITKKNDLEKIDWSLFEVIINAAAYTNVDNAETPEGRILAWEVNAKGTKNLADIAQKHDLTLIHTSTDYVFDGTNKSHDEEEPFSPINVYGQSKAAGDLVASMVPKYYLLRTSWVIGDGKNFVQTMIELAKKSIEPKIVADQIGRPTFTKELTRIIDHLINNQPEYGTYNASNSGPATSWADLTRLIFKLGNYDLSVEDISTEEYFREKPQAAKRPLNSLFNLDKLQLTGFNSNDWQDDLKSYLKERI